MYQNGLKCLPSLFNNNAGQTKIEVILAEFNRINNICVEQLHKQETRMLSQALNLAMLHSRNQLEGVNRKKLIC